MEPCVNLRTIIIKKIKSHPSHNEFDLLRNIRKQSTSFNAPSRRVSSGASRNKSAFFLLLVLRWQPAIVVGCNNLGNLTTTTTFIQLEREISSCLPGCCTFRMSPNFNQIFRCKVATHERPSRRADVVCKGNTPSGGSE